MQHVQGPVLPETGRQKAAESRPRHGTHHHQRLDRPVYAKINVPVALWEVKGGRAKGKSLEADRLNRHLDNIRGQMNKHYQSSCNQETIVSALKVRNAYLRLDQSLKPFCRPSTPMSLRRSSGSVLIVRNHLAVFRATAKHI